MGEREAGGLRYPPRILGLRSIPAWGKGEGRDAERPPEDFRVKVNTRLGEGGGEGGGTERPAGASRVNVRSSSLSLIS